MTLEDLAKQKAMVIVEINDKAQLIGDNDKIYLPRAFKLLLFVDEYKNERLSVTTIYGEQFYLKEKDIIKYKVLGHNRL